MLISYILILLSGCLWGSMGAMFKGLQSFGITSTQAAFCRMLVATILFGVYFLIRNRKAFRVTWKQLLALFVAGGIGSGTFSMTYFMAVSETTVSFVAAMTYTAPAFVAIFSVFLFKEKLTKRKLVSLALILVGSILVTGVLQTAGVHYSLKGILLGLSCGFAYSLYSLFLRMALLKGSSIESASFYCMLFAFIIIAPFGNMESALPQLADPRCLALVAALGIFTAAVPGILYSIGMSRVESSKAAMLATVDLVVATILGVALFHDSLSILQISGIVLILGSVMILSYNEEEKRHAV